MIHIYLVTFFCFLSSITVLAKDTVEVVPENAETEEAENIETKIEDSQQKHTEEQTEQGEVGTVEEQTQQVDVDKITESVRGQVLDKIDFNEIDSVMKEVLPNQKVTFENLLACIMMQDYEAFNDLAYTFVVDQFFYELSYNKETIVHILMLAILAAIFTNFASAFGNEKVSEFGFYIVYLLVLIISLQSFHVIVTEVATKLDYLLTFMSALCPIYFLTVALSTGVSSSVMFYNLSLMYIYIVELLIGCIVIPLINAYLVIQMLNYLTTEKKLSKLAGFVKLIINWMLKIFLAGVIGLNVVQGFIAPVIDKVQKTAWLKGAESIPVIGDAMSGTGEIVIGTLKLIKNGVGVAGLLICCAILAGPFIQMVVLTLMYKFIAAIIEPVSDKRISNCVHSVGESCQILLYTVVRVGLLFLITIAIVTATTSL